MEQKRTPADIAATVFKALPHINQVWVDEKAQLFHLDARKGGTLIKRPEHESSHPLVHTPAEKINEVKH